MNQQQIATLILLGALWGASFLFLRITVPAIGTIWTVEFRALIAGLSLLPLVLSQELLSQFKTHYRQLVIIGLLNAALPFSLLAYTAIELSAGFTAILNATVPIFSALFAYLVIKETLSNRTVFGILLGFFGVVVLMSWQQPDMSPPPLLSISTGLLAAISYVLAAYYTKAKMTAISPLVYVTGSQLAAAIFILPLLPFSIPSQAPDLTVILSIAGLAIPSTSLAFLLYFRLIRDIGPTKTLTVTYLIPLFAIIWGYWLLDEGITPVMLVGCALILTGTALTNGVRFSKIRKEK